MLQMRHKKGEANGRERLYSADDKNKKSKTFSTVWNGWLLTFFVVFLVLVVAIPSLKADMVKSPVSETVTETNSEGTVASNGGATPIVENNASTSTKENNEEVISIPECESSPWKEDEDLVGTCPGELKPKADISNAMDCAASCCTSDECITFQFRADRGCLQGKDVRIGEEKDGPSAYCSDHPPYRWQGQFLKDGRKDTECSTDTWHPDEQQGQCFGLGEARKGIPHTAADCMKACCADEECKAWQFQESLGCFYNKRMFTCQKSDDPMVFEFYVGRRKRLSTRTYTGKRGKPAVNWKRSTTSSSGGSLR